MDPDRRNLIQLTAAGLIHVGTRPLLGATEAAEPIDLIIRRAQERGHADLGWLKSYHTFSFGDYYDQRHMGFRSLRVINDDRVAAGAGFPTHPHRDMEILTYLTSGALEHRDSTGRGSIIQPGDVQHMSAGTGITHSEFNPSSTADNHFLQIWIKPSQRGLRPTYQENKLEAGSKKNRWRRIADPAGAPGVVLVRQDATLFDADVETGRRVEHTVEAGRHAWLHIVSGQAVVNGTRVTAGDAVATSRPTQLVLEAEQPTNALLFDLG